MTFNRQSAEQWDAIDEIGKKLGEVRVDGGVSCFLPADDCGALIVEEMQEIARFSESLTQRGGSATVPSLP